MFKYLSKLFAPAKSAQASYSYTSAVQQSTMKYGIEDLTMGDFNGDGILDFSITRMDWDSVGSNLVNNQIFLGNGKGKFAEGTQKVFPTIPSTNYACKTIARDFNKDGVTDILYVDTGIDKEPFTGGKNTLMLSQKGKLVNATSSMPQTLQNNHGASIGDINNDGYLDILTTSFGTINTPASDTLYLNNKGAGFVANNQLMPTSGSVHYASGLVDINRDGWVDLVVGGSSANNSNSQVFVNNKGSFNTSTPINLPKSGIKNEAVLDVDTIDLNHDKWPDLVMTMIDESNYKTPYLQFLVNDGKGGFTDQTSKYLPQSKIGGADGAFIKYTDVIDLNHDGNMDIVTHGMGVKSSVYMNDGKTFTKVMETNGIWDRLALGDVNKDGKTDFIITNAYGNGVETHINNMVDYHVYVNPIGIQPYDMSIGIF